MSHKQGIIVKIFLRGYMFYFHPDYQFIFKTTGKIRSLQRLLKRLPLEHNLINGFSKLVDELIEDFTNEASRSGQTCDTFFFTICKARIRRYILKKQKRRVEYYGFKLNQQLEIILKKFGKSFSNITFSTKKINPLSPNFFIFDGYSNIKNIEIRITFPFVKIDTALTHDIYKYVMEDIQQIQNEEIMCHLPFDKESNYYNVSIDKLLCSKMYTQNLTFPTIRMLYDLKVITVPFENSVLIFSLKNITAKKLLFNNKAISISENHYKTPPCGLKDLTISLHGDLKFVVLKG